MGLGPGPVGPSQLSPTAASGVEEAEGSRGSQAGWPDVGAPSEQ